MLTTSGQTLYLSIILSVLMQFLSIDSEEGTYQSKKTPTCLPLITVYHEFVWVLGARGGRTLGVRAGVDAGVCARVAAIALFRGVHLASPLPMGIASVCVTEGPPAGEIVVVTVTIRPGLPSGSSATFAARSCRGRRPERPKCPAAGWSSCMFSLLM